MARRTIDLAQFDNDFRNQQPDDRSEMDPVPDGKYQVQVEKVELKEAQTTGNPMLTWTLRIIAPRLVNRVMWRNSVITQNTLKYLKTDLHICGLDLDKLSDLPKHLRKLLDVKLEVTKKTKGDNENIFFNRRITTEPAMKPVKGLAGDDDVPF
ncbi:MAG: DUF669 domain-containing protein [Bryobacterales bacterium]|nr:DUF669 domain-containing protein [Bryobacterales bacterium]